MSDVDARVARIRVVVFMSFISTLFIIQALELLLLRWGLKLHGRFFWTVVLVFILFWLPFPFIGWLINNARQPSFWQAAFLVRPTFAWHFDWLTFFVFICPVIFLLRIGAFAFHSEALITANRWIVAGVVGLGAVVTIIGLALAGRPPGVTTLELRIPGLTRKDDGIRVVQLTDTHLAWWTSDRESRRIAETVKKLSPDLLLITGDMVDHNPKYCEAFAAYLKDVQPRLGRFAIIGNHDVYTGRDEVARRMEANGIRMLRAGWVSLQDKGADLVVGGMDDSGEGWTRGDPWEDRIAGIVKTCPKGLPIIWMGHRPTSFDQTANLPVALTLSGHTHGGQLRLPFHGPGLADIKYKHAMGFYEQNGRMLYVSRGTGTVGWPFRIACPEEVTLIILRAP